MVDIHCHILPNLDDGARDLEESVAMARLAAASGVTDLAATPHFRGGPGSMEQIPRVMEALTRLRECLAREQVPLTLHPGVEILCTPQTPDMGALGALPTLGAGNYLLTEFYFDETERFMTDILDALAARGYRIVIAHPERYEAVREDPHLARRWFDRGFLLQLNKGSVLGAFGRRVRQTAEVLLEDGLAHAIASDGHGSVVRTPYLTDLRRWTLEHLGPAYTRILLEENPARILRGEPPVPPDVGL